MVGAGFIGLGTTPSERLITFEQGELDKIWTELAGLIDAYNDADKGYPARRAVHENRWKQDYDQLARFGEWDITDAPVTIKVGR